MEVIMKMGLKSPRPPLLLLGMPKVQDPTGVYLGPSRPMVWSFSGGLI